MSYPRQLKIWFPRWHESYLLELEHPLSSTQIDLLLDRIRHEVDNHNIFHFPHIQVEIEGGPLAQPSYHDLRPLCIKKIPAKPGTPDEKPVSSREGIAIWLAVAWQVAIFDHPYLAWVHANSRRYDLRLVKELVSNSRTFLHAMESRLLKKIEQEQDASLI